MALDEAGHRLFVVCRTPARLLAIDSDTGTITGRAGDGGRRGRRVLRRLSSKRIYVSGGDGAIAVHARREANDGREIVRLDTAKGARTSLFVPDLRRLFLAVRRQGDAPGSGLGVRNGRVARRCGRARAPGCGRYASGSGSMAAARSRP